MPHPLLSEALQEAYVSASTVKTVVETLEVSFGDINFDGEAFFVCSGFKRQQFNLGADGWRWFDPMPFKFKLPNQDATGAQGLSVAVENVSGGVLNFIRNALAVGDPVVIKYRTFFEESPETCQTPRPLVLSIEGAKSTLAGSILSAKVADFVNRTFPNGFYSYTSYPGLRG